jgi:hypothetical protein
MKQVASYEILRLGISEHCQTTTTINGDGSGVMIGYGRNDAEAYADAVAKLSKFADVIILPTRPKGISKRSRITATGVIFCVGIRYTTMDFVDRDQNGCFRS